MAGMTDRERALFINALEVIHQTLRELGDNVGVVASAVVKGRLMTPDEFDAWEKQVRAAQAVERAVGESQHAAITQLKGFIEELKRLAEHGG